MIDCVLRDFFKSSKKSSLGQGQLEGGDLYTRISEDISNKLKLSNGHE